MLGINKKIQILLIEDEEYDVRRVKNTVQPFEDNIIISDIVSNGKSAIDLLTLKKDLFDIVIMDFQIAGGIMGESLIQKIKEIETSIQIIVITKMTINISDYNFANRLLKAGAFWYCTKYPGDIEEYIYQPTDFILSIFNAYEKCLLERERSRSNAKLVKNVEEVLIQKRIIGSSQVISQLKSEIGKYAQSNVNTLI